MEKESDDTTINDVPDEVLQEIFKFLPTTPDSLKNARLVSRKWRTNASSICRRRFVSLSKPGIRDMHKIFKSIFTDSRSIPWSCVTFTEAYPIPSRSRPFTAYRRRVLRDFGVHLWRLNSEQQDWDKLLHFLQFTPNLRVLVLNCSDDSFRKGRKSLNLPLLKSLKINITADSLDFLHYLLKNCAVRLVKIKLKVDLDEVDIEMANKLMSLLNTFSVPTIFLTIIHESDNEEVMPVIAAGNLKLRKLNLHFSEPSPDNEAFLASVGQMLEASSQYLHSLTMNCDLRTGECTRVLQFPILSALKVLNITFGDNFMETSKEFRYQLFSSVETKNFPVLEKVAMKYDMTVDEDTPEFFNKDLCKFEAVTDLELQYGDAAFLSTAVDWTKLFPNVKKLKADVSDESLPFILKNMQYLEYLDLSFYGIYGASLNSILSGIPEAEEVYEENEELIVKLRALYGRPSLLSLPLLRTFKLNCVSEDERDDLRDSGAYLGILPLQPLDLLSLSNTDLSTECIARLRERHRVVVVEID